MALSARASSLRKTREERARRHASSSGSTWKGGYSQMAPAPMETVSSYPSLETMCGSKPSSASISADVSPLTPAPSTSTFRRSRSSGEAM